VLQIPKRLGEDQMNFTMLIKLLPLFAFIYFVLLPVSLAYIVEWIIHYWFLGEVLQFCGHAVIGWLDAPSGLFGLRSIQMASI